ncbi:hypothetical protein CBR_g48628 [Chara braunii]|uniref:non-specific serine/threonine protein kinase n=1 Tax=Chara braunii TaxID=69332 RepID=A0A388M3G9_CHABU|nr:hypothetical protein CBR_g48628 [Chara braunii]|eukprot:GBG89019.1 hypothetical protein CBR_g48628 [Chara braunii]
MAESEPFVRVCGSRRPEGPFTLKGGVVRRRGLWRTYDAESGKGERVLMKTISLTQPVSLRLRQALAEYMRAFSMSPLPQRTPSIPGLLDSFWELGSDNKLRLFLIMKGVEGKSLREIVAAEASPFSEEEVVDMAVEVLQVLSRLEQSHPPVIHGNIDPGNIIVDVEKARLEGTWVGHVKVVGLETPRDCPASELAGESSERHFLAPEQLENRPVSQSDLYGLGATVLYLLSGRPPSAFPRDQLCLQFREQVPMTVKLADVLDRLLKPRPEDRFTNARDVILALRWQRPPRHSSTHSATPTTLVEPNHVSSQLSHQDGTAVSRPQPSPRNVIPDCGKVTLISGNTWVVVGDRPKRANVDVSSDGKEMFIDIPARGLHFACVFELLLMSLCLLGFFPGGILAMVSVSMFYLMLLAPYLCCVCLLARCRWRRVTPSLSVRIAWGGSYRVCWSRPGGKCKIMSGEIKNVQGVGVAVEVVTKDEGKKHEIIKGCEVVELTRKVRFGEWFSSRKAVWLADEMSKFIEGHKQQDADAAGEAMA